MIFKYIVRDLKNLKHKRPDTGIILGFCSSKYSCFGSGKTLSMVKYLLDLKEYDNHNYLILTNIDININRPDFAFRHISSFSDICYYLDYMKENYKPDCYTIYICLDELACLMNSRDFQTNFTKDFLAKLVTCRHYRCNLIYTAQRFDMIDKTFRNLSLSTALCRNVFWRFYRQYYYYSADLERADDSVIKPYMKKFYFLSDKLCCYDTLASFKDFERRQSAGLVEDVQIDTSFVSVTKSKSTRCYRKAKSRNKNAV